jgi:hypothetical protein
MKTAVQRAVPLAAALLACAIATPSQADGHGVAPVKDPVVAKECSACHMIYPAGLLPARSWQRLMGGLNDHFGDNAELDDATRQRITDYLAANAADARGGGGKGMRELPDNAVPLRISEMPWFLRKHGKKGRIAPDTLKRRGANSASDCKACHQGAEQGLFDDD